MKCQLTETFFDVLRSLQEAQKCPRDCGTGQPLYHAEVEFLDAVYTKPGANASELSKLLGITRGAVTQYATKLGAKGLVESYQRQGDKKQKYFRLTAAGETAHKGHEQFHREANEKLCAYFCSLAPEQTELLFQFLNTLKACVPFCEFHCKNIQADGKE